MVDERRTRGEAPQGSGARPSAADFTASPFTRLARVQALMVAGDTLVAVALAGSLFFDIDPQAARSRVLLYLLLTMAPFAVVAPLIGPAIDRVRGGGRVMVMASAGGRALVCALMIVNLGSLLLFPLAFAVLVLGKTYHVTKSSLVPTVVTDDAELVEANAKLGLISGLVGFVAAVPGLLLSLVGSSAVVGLAAVVFGVGFVAALALPRTTVAATPIDDVERAELRSAGILLAASAMAIVRATVGFLTFLVAFWFRRTDTPTAWYGLVLACSGLGGLFASALGPAVRRRAREEVMLLGALVTAGGAALVALLLGGRPGAALLALAVGLAAATGKLAFDAIVQRDAPDANRGRSFARFETRFQLVWVVGAMVPVLVPGGIPQPIGYLLIAGACAAGTATYVVGLRTLRVRGVAPTPVRVKAAEAVRRRLGDRTIGPTVPGLRPSGPRGGRWRRTPPPDPDAPGPVTWGRPLAPPPSSPPPSPSPPPSASSAPERPAPPASPGAASGPAEPPPG